MASTSKTDDDARVAALEAINEIRRSTEKEMAALRSKIETLMDERVTPEVEGMIAKAETVARDTGTAIRHQADRVADQVQERPLLALGIAAAVGYLVAVILRR